METDASVESVWLTRLNEPANDGINLFDVGTDQFYGSDRDRAGLCYQASVVMNKILKVSVGKLLFNNDGKQPDRRHCQTEDSSWIWH